MSVTLTDHQWQQGSLAVEWYKDADKNRHMFERTFQTADEFGRGGKLSTMLGLGQDFFFGGFAGTGKTTVLPAIIDGMGLTPEDVAFCAPTGKAAKVMGEKLRAFGMQVQPTTIHKLIYLPKRANADRIQARIESLSTQIFQCKIGEQLNIYYNETTLSIPEAEATIQQLNFDLIRAMENNEGPQFSLRAFDDFPEKIKLIVVDEGSMVGIELANDLASFGRPILAFGDPGQLPPVGEDYGFECLQPDAFLTEIHRQAKDNPIIHLATLAREGKALKIGDYGQGVRVVDRRDDKDTLDMSREAMVICGTHKKRWTLTKKIRTALGYTESGPCVGEPLLFCKNSQKLELMVNGTIVTCDTEIGELRKGMSKFDIAVKDDEGGGALYNITCVQGIFEEHQQRKRNAYTAPSNEAFKAKKDCEHLDWGHVLTCHKSQGSQWPNVVVHDESGAFRDAADRWLYTALTRAEKELTVVV